MLLDLIRRQYTRKIKKKKSRYRTQQKNTEKKLNFSCIPTKSCQRTGNFNTYRYRIHRYRRKTRFCVENFNKIGKYRMVSTGIPVPYCTRRTSVDTWIVLSVFVRKKFSKNFTKWLTFKTIFLENFRYLRPCPPRRAIPMTDL
jgi:hypothetical protein